jgi:hypothetical protein
MQRRGGGRSGGGAGGGGRGAGGGGTGGFRRGPGGECLCSKCGKRIPHERGVPCPQVRCPQCGTAMTRA